MSRERFEWHYDKASDDRLRSLVRPAHTLDACEVCGRGFKPGDIVTRKPGGAIVCKLPACGPSPETRAILEPS